jgi:uncharacterized membrane protein YoaK (UPF0700 family)
VFRHNAEYVTYTKENVLLWLLLAFQAGAVNAGSFLACQRFVTHTTGFATHVGVDFAMGDYTAMAGMLSVPIFFLFGGMISAFFVDRRMKEGVAPLFIVPAGLIFIIFLAVAVLGGLGYFGVFYQAGPHTLIDYSFMISLCLASGIQNALITSAGGRVVRTTHLTGVTTDLAIGIISARASKNKGLSSTKEIRANWARAGTIFLFIIGSITAAWICFRVQYWGFLLPAATAFYIWLIALRAHFSAAH